MKYLNIYRGINLINEMFVYGYLTIDPITLSKVIQSFDMDSEEVSTFNIDQCKVDICIGQDTDGNNIFENDIVRILYTDYTSQDNWIECVIQYNEEDKQFEGVSIKTNKYGEYEKMDLNLGKFGWIKVVGNKYNL